MVALGLALAASLAGAQQKCDPALGACVRELPPEGVVQESWSQEMPQTIPEGAWVRELPEDYVPPPPPVEWGWTALDIPMDGPATDPVRGQCARSPEQALAWIMGPAHSQNEAVVNRALSAYDWRGHTSKSSEGLITWIAAWPAGNWEQQTGWSQEGERQVRRYRYVTGEGAIQTWVRATKTQGCWLLKPAPPREQAPNPEPNIEPTLEGQNEQRPEDPPNLEILWEAPPSG